MSERGWSAFGASDIGLARARNEDAYALDDELGCYLVADGLGGHRGGDVASAMARDAVMRHVGEHRGGAAGEVLAAGFRAANRAIRHAASEDPSLRGMGTTLSALWLDRPGARGIIAHVGDSRVYALGDGDLTQLTDDHTLGMELARAGAPAPGDAERWYLSNQLTRAVGLETDLDVDIAEHDLAAIDALLLCSDGLTGMVGDDAIAGELAGHRGNPRTACEALIAAALDAGGDDNVTVIVLYRQ